MKCPVCNSKLRLVPSGHDEHVISYCENPRCNWQRAVGTADPEQDHLHSSAGFAHYNTSTMTRAQERAYNG